MAITKLNALKARLEDAVEEGADWFQHEIYFANERGASIVRNALSGGGRCKTVLFEVAMLDDNAELDYSVWNDSDLGYLDVAGVLEKVKAIKAMPSL